jgi:hypothetical protein
MSNGFPIKSINGVVFEYFVDNDILSSHALSQERYKMTDDFGPCPYKSNDKQYKQKGRQNCIILTVDSIVVDIPNESDKKVDKRKENGPDFLGDFRVWAHEDQLSKHNNPKAHDNQFGLFDKTHNEGGKSEKSEQDYVMIVGENCV